MSLKAHPEQELADHLTGVASRAARFAKAFDAERQAKLAGLLHDLGKAESQFQARLTGSSDEKLPHAPHGAALALERQLWPVAFAVNGHHAGLHNRSSLQQVAVRYAAKAHNCLNTLSAEGWREPIFTIDDKPLPRWLDKLPFSTAAERSAKMRAVDFYTRMLFSVLVDADRLDTEEASQADGSQANVRKRQSWRFGESALASPDAISALQRMLDGAVATRVAAAKAKCASTAVLNVRAEVLTACREKADSTRGVFTLTVPTGGGKTLASLAFALAHARAHGLRRIIIVIPYLNIIQQTTKELKEVFGHTDSDPIVLEHHSQASDPAIKGKENDKKNPDIDGWDKERPLRQLAAENWDAPVVVTTSVQFFDSLFSRRPSDARKLHNLCQSVIIFDEVQTLPPLLLQPILDALQELANPARPYGCSLVLCTATLPALRKSDDLPFGFAETTPIIPEAAAAHHFRDLRRVEYHGRKKTRCRLYCQTMRWPTPSLARPASRHSRF
jgi:CRISPR-associated endonuclease/helicase Cas3